MKECKCSMRIKIVGDGCAICNPELAREIERDNLLEAAQAVVDRWDSPLWKDAGPTADCIAVLRKAISKSVGA